MLHCHGHFRCCHNNDINVHMLLVKFLYLCTDKGLHRGIDAYLPVAVFFNMRHNQLGFFHFFGGVVEDCIVTLWLLGATHGKCIDIEHGFKCWISHLLSEIESSPVDSCVSSVYFISCVNLKQTASAPCFRIWVISRLAKYLRKRLKQFLCAGWMAARAGINLKVDFVNSIDGLGW